MKKSFSRGILIVLIALTGFNLYSQKKNVYTERDDDEYVENRDSTWGLEFDYSELDPTKVRLNVLAYKLRKLKAYNDSMMNIVRMKNIKERSDSLQELYDLLAGDTTSSYNAYSFFGGAYHSSVSDLNKNLASLGWPKISDMSFHVTGFLDFTWKRRRIINDIFIAQGTAQSVSRKEVSVTYTYMSPLNYNIGYCVVDKKRLQIFPYAGLLYQSAELDFVNTAVQPFDIGAGSYDSLIKAAAVNKKGAEYKFKKREIVLNYGIELDLHLVYSKRKTGFLIGFRAGGGLPLLSTGWMLDGSRYSQLNSTKIRDYYYDIVLRVYLRRPTRGGPYYLQTNWWEK
jgi:hypothetical protein